MQSSEKEMVLKQIGKIQNFTNHQRNEHLKAKKMLFHTYQIGQKFESLTI